MNRFSRLLGIAVLVGCAGSAWPAHPPAAADPALAACVLADEDARFATMVRADAVELGAWLADDLQYVHSNAVVETRDQLLDSIASGRIRYLGVQAAERQVVLLGARAALVRGLARFQVATDAARLDVPIRYLAVYSERDGRWQLRSWQSLRLPETPQ